MKPEGESISLGAATVAGRRRDWLRAKTRA
jgi:hypothetical protein